MAWSFFPADERQRVRVERVLLAAGGSLFAIVVALALAASDLLPLRQTAIFCCIVTALVIGGYALIRSGLNLWFSDPNLTVPFLCSAALAVSYLTYYADQASGAMFEIYIIAFMFGVLTLRPVRLVLMALFYWGCALGTVLMREGFAPQTSDMRREMVLLTVFLMVLAWFTALGWYVGGLRGRLKATREKMIASMEELERLAKVDSLTGCYNRRHALEFLAVECKRAERGEPLSLGILDLDHFKSVNDEFGHQGGDQVLKAVAQAVQPLLRATDMLVRYGGEEFLLILPQTCTEAALIVCERIRKTIGGLCIPRLPSERRVTVSIGLSLHEAGEPIAETFKRADAALYEAKHQGRNRVVTHARVLAQRTASA